MAGFIQDPMAAPTNCFSTIGTEIVHLGNGQTLVAFVAGWGQDGVLYVLAYDPGTERFPVKLCWIKPHSRFWNTGKPEFDGWQRQWFKSNPDEVARGMHHAFVCLNTGHA